MHSGLTHRFRCHAESTSVDLKSLDRPTEAMGAPTGSTECMILGLSMQHEVCSGSDRNLRARDRPRRLGQSRQLEDCQTSISDSSDLLRFGIYAARG